MSSSNAPKKRSAIAAFLLNAIFCPAGYVYVGKARLGVLIYAALFLFAVAVFVLTIAFPPGFYALVNGSALNLRDAYIVAFVVAAALGVHAAVLAGTPRPRLTGGAFWAAIIGLPLAAYGASLSMSFAWPYSVYNIPSESGVPTILNGDIVLARGPKLRCGSAKPKLGDIVVYRRKDTSYIKRLVGMPGDKIQFDRGALVLNGQVVPQKVEGQSNLSLGGFVTRADVVRETLPNGKSYLVSIADRSQPPENTQPVTLGPDQYFFVGDSRDNSLDSQFDGPTTRDKLCGVAVKILNSSNRSHIGQRP